MDEALRQELDIFVADRVGLTGHVPAALAPTGERKLVVFTPDEALDAVRDALFAAGAGRIGVYERCSFYAPGTGTFFGGEESAPTVGEAGREERVGELRLEVLYPAELEAAVIAAVVSAPPTRSLRSISTRSPTCQRVACVVGSAASMEISSPACGSSNLVRYSCDASPAPGRPRCSQTCRGRARPRR